MTPHRALQAQNPDTSGQPTPTGPTETQTLPNEAHLTTRSTRTRSSTVKHHHLRAKHTDTNNKNPAIRKHKRKYTRDQMKTAREKQKHTKTQTAGNTNTTGRYKPTSPTPMQHSTHASLGTKTLCRCRRQEDTWAWETSRHTVPTRRRACKHNTLSTPLSVLCGPARAGAAATARRYYTPATRRSPAETHR